MFDKRKDAKSEPVKGTTQSQQGSAASQGPAAANIGRIAMIGPGIKIKGDVTGDENLIVKGTVEGSINLGSNQVEVDEVGTVNANVTAKVVKVSGKIVGDVTGNEKVVIMKSGNVRGNIVAPRVTLEDGAIFKGSIDMDPRDAAAELPLQHKNVGGNVKPISDEAAKQDSGLAAKGN